MPRKPNPLRRRAKKRWQHMIDRCTKPHHPRFPDYGGRGIGICARWMNFEDFYSDVGDAPEGMSFDRVDNDGHYEPGNWRWATPLDQSRNARTTQQTTILDVDIPVPQWKVCEITGRTPKKIQRRLGVLRKRGVYEVQLDELRTGT